MVKKAMKDVQVVVSPLMKLLRDPNRFQKLEDGWVRDKLCGVEWGPSSDKYLTFKQAQAYCKKLGARLPEVNELQSLVDYTKHDPCIDKDLFPDMKSSYYWTGTQHARWSDSAWCVSFSYGSVGNVNKGYDNYVRPVRASQCLIV